MQSNSFWAGVVAPLAALLGVVISLIVQGVRFNKQLSHEREIKKVDRDFEMRKEVYLAAAEALSLGTQCLAGAGNVSIDNFSLFKPYIEKSGAVARAYVIASEETWKALNAFSLALMSVQTDVYVRRAPLLLLDARKAEHQQVVETAMNERARLVMLMKEHNINQEANPAKLKILSENFRFETQMIEKNQTEIAQLNEALRIGGRELAKVLVDHLAALSGLSLNVLAQVRKELKMPIAIEEYRAVNHETFRQIRATFEQQLGIG